jgi:hypothetical protein
VFLLNLSLCHKKRLQHRRPPPLKKSFEESVVMVR